MTLGRCWCTDSASDYQRHGTSSNCNMECSGDSDEYCGGIYAMTVSESDSYDQADGFRGCFRDRRNRRVFNEHTKFNDRMTTKVSLNNEKICVTDENLLIARGVFLGWYSQLRSMRSSVWNIGIICCA